MKHKYAEYKGLNLPQIAEQVLTKWENESIFKKSIDSREGKQPFIFFEGPPSANGLPGIHHVMARSIKDIFCRYKTLKGYQVKRKAGWDTHGLPIELGVEKELGITKEDIGKKISVQDYNKACKEAVMRYTDTWNDLTRKMGYWVDMDNPYITYETKYMESVWWLLSQLYQKNLLYKGYTIQPYSPKAGTGLSSHELNQPGCYKDVTDTTVVAQFKITHWNDLAFPTIDKLTNEYHFLAWTTTPWTLPSNTALCVGPNIEYVVVSTYNQYTFQAVNVILAKELLPSVFAKGYLAVNDITGLTAYKSGDKQIPYFILDSCKGKDLVGIKYEQLMPYVLPSENPEEAFRVISGDFVTTGEGTGIVHIAPTFGSDDARVAAEAGVPAMLIKDESGNLVPLVDLQGRYRPECGELAGMFVKNDYYSSEDIPDRSVDVLIAIQLKTENKAFKVEKYVHSYPHCWRTDKPVLYYPLDSWFIKVTAVKERMIALNKTINWKPESTGTGRFGKWLESANDWNLSRSRYWGIPIPIWSTAEGEESICIGSLKQLKEAIERSIQKGFMASNPLDKFDPDDMSDLNYNQVDIHKNYVDEIILVSDSGKPMRRESDLIDVWFDSGAMPYAQWHYPFENQDLIDKKQGFPGDFIAEGVDQTRGWFYTLHAIATMVFDTNAYKNVISNGLVLDKNGQKMSKRLGNAIDPFQTLNTYGPDATRWYMITNAQPWDNLKFDLEGIVEVQRKFFGTLYNTYSFFALYANIDGFDFTAPLIPINERPEIDRWILSKLHSLIKEVDNSLAEYEPTKAGRLIQDFVTDQLSNWYVRLCRRRFWKSDDLHDKQAAYQTLYTCLETVAILASPIAPFYMDQLYTDLNSVTHKHTESSVHLAEFPVLDETIIDQNLEKQMEIAQRVSSLVLALRKKERIKVRQPLAQIMVPSLSKEFSDHVLHVKDLIMSEVNVKTLNLLEENSTLLVKRIKPNFKTIGPKYGKQMKIIADWVNKLNNDDILEIEKNQGWSGEIDGQFISLNLEDFEITAQDIPGWLVASEEGITVALDINISADLKEEGIARELINRVQNLRKDKGLEVTDRIRLQINTLDTIQNAIQNNSQFICNEVLADEINFTLLSEVDLLTDLENEGDTAIALIKN
jgi:isoleucyl-tRNA synthetase